MQIKKSFVLFFIISLLFVSCTSTKNASQKKEYLLIKNSIKVDKSYVKSGDLSGLTTQKPLRGLTSSFFRPGIWFYKKSMQGKETGFKRFQRKAFGKEPVYMDSTHISQTIDNFNAYLKNKGFYHASVDYSVKLSRKTAKVYYNVLCGTPCIVDTISYAIPDTNIIYLIKEQGTSSKLKPKMIFDTYLLNDERTYMSDILRDNGYYSVSLNEIYYVVDMSDDKNSADVEVRMKKWKRRSDTSDVVQELSHPKFYINKIDIITNAKPEVGFQKYDSLAVQYKPRRKSPITNTANIFWQDKLQIRPSVLTSILQVHDNQLFSQQNVNNTYKRFIKLPIIKSASITMQESERHSPDSNFVDCRIRLLHNKNKIFNFGVEGTNSAGMLGTGFRTGIVHKNIFRGAEVFSLNLRTNAEIQPLTMREDADNLFLIFNTLEASGETSLSFPRILLPLKLTSGWGIQEASSSLNFGVGYMLRPQYARSLISLSWNYNWQFHQNLKHTFTPVELNYINVLNIREDFQNYLDSLSDPHFKSVFTNHLLTTIRYNMVLSSGLDTKSSRQYSVRFNIETSGNMLYLYDKYITKLETEDYYSRLGVRYAQYFRTDVDYRTYWNYAPNANVAFRFLAGISIPYGNSQVVPFEKSFWLGGANDMRGWKLRALGPGGYSKETNVFDKSGNIILQSSIEQRFPIYSFLNGAIFADAGNIWLISKIDDFEGAEFQFSEFYKQIALDVGLGLRFNFNFFVFRVDWALPLAYPDDNSAFINTDKIKLRNGNFNFGIGYPF
ncbi:MAG: BamA/TamA family outer membrane protein [Bacteroidales bacterium]